MRHRKGRFTAVILLALATITLSFTANAPSRASTPAPATTPPQEFTPGVPWADTGGNLIQGHNGSVIKVGSTYYWIGQDLASRPRTDAACYTSTDLVHWTRALNPVDPTKPILSVAGLGAPAGWSGTAPQYLIGPAKVIEASPTEFVMWVGVKVAAEPRPYNYFLVDVATSSIPCGQYTWNRTSPWLPFGHPSGDIGLYRDDNGTAYLLSEDQGIPCSYGTTDCYEALPGPAPHTACKSTDTGCLLGQGLRIYQLQSGYLSIQGTVFEFDQDYEAPTMFKIGSTYYVLASEKTGWKPNDNQYSYTTTSPSGGWSGWSDLAPSGSFTCDSQNFYVLPVQGTNKNSDTTFIYLGDLWDSTHTTDDLTDTRGDSLGDSGYIWLPLKISGSSISIDCGVQSWAINTATGDPDLLASPYFTLTNVNSGKAMEVPSYSKTAGTAVDQASGNGRTDQQWQVINVYDTDASTKNGNQPRYEIMNVHSGMALEVRSASTTAGATLDQAPYTGATSQFWQFVSVNNGPGLTLRNVNSGMVAEVPNSSTADGTTLDQAPSTVNTNQPADAANQQWALTQVPGYWAYSSLGNVYNQANTAWFGSLAKSTVDEVVALVPTSDGSGYWLVQANGDVSAFGDATPVGNITISSACNLGGQFGPIEGAVADPNPQQGGVWAYTWCGDVYAEAGANPNLGSLTSKNLENNGLEIVAFAAASGGNGYWMIDNTGTVYNFGTGATQVTGQICAGQCVVDGAAGDPQGGFWAWDDFGNVYPEAGAPSFGDKANTPMCAFAPTPDGLGYWLIDCSDNVYHFGDATEGASVPGSVAGAVADPAR